MIGTASRSIHGGRYNNVNVGNSRTLDGSQVEFAVKNVVGCVWLLKDRLCYRWDCLIVNVLFANVLFANVDVVVDDDLDEE